MLTLEIIRVMFQISIVQAQRASENVFFSGSMPSDHSLRQTPLSTNSGPALATLAQL